MRPRVRPDRRDPVIRRDPDTFFDVTPWKKTDRSARRAISGGEANSTNRRGLPGHESSLQAGAMRLSPPPVTPESQLRLVAQEARAILASPGSKPLAEWPQVSLLGLSYPHNPRKPSSTIP